MDEVHKKPTPRSCHVLQYHFASQIPASQMAKKKQRKIQSRTTRGMLTWAPFRFQQRLINKTREYRQCMVIIGDESYISKSCGSCGHIQQELGGNKLFKCPNCGVFLDRDSNGARNFLLKSLVDFHPKSAQATLGAVSLTSILKRMHYCYFVKVPVTSITVVV